MARDFDRQAFGLQICRAILKRYTTLAILATRLVS